MDLKYKMQKVKITYLAITLLLPDIVLCISVTFNAKNGVFTTKMGSDKGYMLSYKSVSKMKTCCKVTCINISVYGTINFCLLRKEGD